MAYIVVQLVAAVAVVYAAKKLYDCLVGITQANIVGSVVPLVAAAAVVYVAKLYNCLFGNTHPHEAACVVGCLVQLVGAVAMIYGAKKLYDCLFGNNHELKDKLERYYQSHVKIKPSDMNKAQGVADEVIEGVQRHLQSTYLSLAIGGLQQVGSTTEDLKVVAPDEFDFMVPIGLDVNAWKLEDAAHRAPGFWLLRKAKWSLSSLDNFMAGDYLSPAKIRSSFQGTLMRFVSNYTGRYRIRVSTHGPSVTLTVTYDHYRTLSIDIVPTLSLVKTFLWVFTTQNVKIVGKPHPLSLRGYSAYDTLWRHSFSIEEGKQLRRFSTNRACHTKCLKILKAIRLDNAQLSMLSSYHLKTLLLHQMRFYSAENHWSHGALEDRFVGMVKALRSYVKDRRLPHFFTPEVNLLAHLQSNLNEQDALFNLENYLNRVIRKYDFVSLLDS